MRSVTKGAAPRVYTDYKAARNDLAGRMGWYCSYCEMPVKNMIEVEHAHPVNKGGGELDWSNFLLACRYCNGIKTDRNAGRAGYLWPDIDNTTLTFKYSEVNIIEPARRLPANINQMAIDTIDLTGLNRTPHSANEPSDRDSRWINRILAWGVIEDSYKDWVPNQTADFARQIARTATGHGYYSFWMKRFQNEPLVVAEINASFLNTYTPQFDAAGNLIVRAGGSF